MNNFRRKKRQENLIGYLFILPLIIYFLVFQLVPILMSFGISFTKWNMRKPPIFVGLDNYKQLFTNSLIYPNFWNSMLVTLKYILMTVPISVVLVLVVASLLNSLKKGDGIFKTIFYIPSVTASAAIAAVWIFMLDPQYGLINQLLGTHIVFLANKSTALGALAVMAIWGGLGYNTLIMLSAMKNIDPALYEAASIDGAGSFKKFLHITIPSVAPITFFITVTSLIGAFQAFDAMYLMTGGGPEGSTLTYMLELYKQAFEYGKMGIASAMSYILFIIILIITFVQFKFQPSEDKGRKEKKAYGKIKLHKKESNA